MAVGRLSKPGGGRAGGSGCSNCAHHLLGLNPDHCTQSLRKLERDGEAQQAPHHPLPPELLQVWRFSLALAPYPCLGGAESAARGQDVAKRASGVRSSEPTASESTVRLSSYPGSRLWDVAEFTDGEGEWRRGGGPCPRALPRWRCHPEILQGPSSSRGSEV